MTVEEDGIHAVLPGGFERRVGAVAVGPDANVVQGDVSGISANGGAVGAVTPAAERAVVGEGGVVPVGDGGVGGDDVDGRVFDIDACRGGGDDGAAAVAGEDFGRGVADEGDFGTVVGGQGDDPAVTGGIDGDDETAVEGFVGDGAEGFPGFIEEGEGGAVADALTGPEVCAAEGAGGDGRVAISGAEEAGEGAVVVEAGDIVVAGDDGVAGVAYIFIERGDPVVGFIEAGRVIDGEADGGGGGIVVEVEEHRAAGPAGTGEPAVIFGGVEVHGLPDGMEIGEADDGVGGAAGAGEGGEQQANQHGDDSDGDEQFDQCEGGDASGDAGAGARTGRAGGFSLSWHREGNKAPKKRLVSIFG